MRKIILVLLILLVFIISVSALTVELKEPKNNIEIRSDINNINFKCNITTGGINIDSVRLYANIFGEWKQTGNILFNQKEGIVSFLITNISQGTYIWNCLATVPGETKFAVSNNTFTFTAPENVKPVFNGTIPDKSWYQDTSLSNAINLKGYFFDEDNKPSPLRFTISGNSNIEVTFSDGVVSFSQPSGWFGIETVYFRATDGQDSVQSNPVKLTVIRNMTTSPSENKTNTAPRINPQIPDQIKKITDDEWILNLNNYIEDDESSDGALKLRVEDVGNDVVNITINELSHKVTFMKIGAGENSVKFIVEDPEGLTAEQVVLVKISGEENNLEEELEPAEMLDIISKDPNKERVQIEIGEKQIFEIDISIKNNINISWFVDGIYQDEKGGKFEYLAEEEGTHKIEVLIESNSEEISNEWEVIVVGMPEKIGVNLSAQNLCGNGKVDEGESCISCAEDVVCDEGKICKEGECVKQSSSWITGFSIKDINDMKLWQKIVSGVVLLIIILIITILIIRTRNIKKRKSSVPLSSFDKPKRGFFSRFKKKKEQAFLEKKTSRIETKQEIKTNVEPPSGLEPIIGFINSGLASGDSPKVIKKALLKSGWSRKQVKQAFKSVRK